MWRHNSGVHQLKRNNEEHVGRTVKRHGLESNAILKISNLTVTAVRIMQVIVCIATYYGFHVSICVFFTIKTD